MSVRMSLCIPALLAAGASVGGDQLWASCEVQPRGRQRPPRHLGRRGLEQVDLGARTGLAVGQQLLELGLLPGRIADLAGDGVERDQRRRELDQLITTLRDRRADAAFGVGERHCRQP